MSINLSIRFQHPGAIAHQVSYARIDNTSNPVFTNVQPNPTTSPATIATNIPNGQYQINSIPIYADGRKCDPITIFTDPCPGLISISAVISAGAIVVSYLAPSDAPKVKINVAYPNGGSFSKLYVNDGNDIAIPIPPGITSGDFIVTGQSVCDESSGFYSPPSSQVTVSYNPDNLTIVSSGVGIVMNSLTGLSGFTLPQNIAPGDEVTGLHGSSFGTITFTFTGTPGLQLNATLQIGNQVVQCKNIPNTNGGTVSFNAIAIAATDIIRISINTGSCPT